MNKRKSAGAYGYLTAEATLAISHDLSEFSSTYDYCVVFKMRGSNFEKQSKYAKYAIHAMLEAGLEVFPYLSVQDDELLVLIRAPVSLMLYFSYFFYHLA